MDRSEQEVIIESLCDNLKERMLRNISRLPETWDGVEFRWYMQDIAIEEFTWGTENKKRKRAYRNHKLVYNL